MKRINNYKDFVNEELFGRIFNINKKVNNKKIDKIEACVNKIVEFLKDNDIKDWNDFNKMNVIDRDVVNRLIDSEVSTMDELSEIRFRIRLVLSDRQQLKEYLNELESEEEYEKCAMIAKKLKNIK